MKFLQKQPKSRHHKAEPHQGEPGTNPRQKSPLDCEEIIQRRPFALFGHFLLPLLLSGLAVHKSTPAPHQDRLRCTRFDMEGSDPEGETSLS
jgi:hypothetical protein